MVVTGVAMLWLRPTRDWFAGRPWAAGPAPEGQRRDPISTPSRPVEEARPAPPEPPDRPAPATSPYAAPLPSVVGRPTPYVPRAKRPGALITACVLVWVTCTLVSGMMLLLSLVLAVAREDLFAELERQQPDLDLGGLSHAEIAAGVHVMTAIVVVWCVAAIVLAVLAFRRVGWARVALAVCTGAAGLVSLAAALLSPGLVVLLGATSVTLWLLLRADVAAWFKR
jgi:hypothetical protein